MEKKVSDRFAALTTSDGAAHGKDQRALWLEAAKQVKQEEVTNKRTVEQVTQDRSRTEERQQTNEFRRAVALAR
jgi:hypothetical protein